MPSFGKPVILSFCLFSILLGGYWLTYRGMPLSGDELAMFSAAESLVKYDESRLYSVYYQYPGAGDIPWSQPVHEPMQIVLSIPLYWVAYHLDGVGMLHTVWALSALVTAATGVVIFWTGLTLNYRPMVSFVAALVVGLSTMLWPYTQTAFREPVAAFWVMLAFWLAFQLHKRWRWWQTGVLVLVCAAALLTKEIMFLAFPALMVVLWPAHPTRRTLIIGTGTVLLGLIFIIAVFSLASETNFGSNRFDSRGYLGRIEGSSLDYFLTVMGAYLLSPGRSLWATSPILLLSLYGAWLAHREGNWRLALAPFVLLLTVTAGYGVGGWDWHGGLGWGTRYLIHVVPVMGLLLLPVLQHLSDGKIHRVGWFAGAALLIFSVLIQLGGVLVPTQLAFDILLAEFPEKGARAFQDEATWNPQYTQWYLHLKNVDFDNLSIAWRYAKIGWLAGGLFIALGLGLAWQKTVSRRAFLLQISLFPIVWILGIGFSLHAMEDDPRFEANRPELQNLLASVEQQAGEKDMVLLANPTYLYFFLNSYRGEGVVVTLPYLAGERYSPDQPDPVVEDADRGGGITPNERIDFATSRVINYLNMRYANIWLVMNSGPFFPWAYRPVEEILTSNYFPVSETKWAEDARLIRVYPYYNYRLPTLVTRHHPFTFGENLTLAGYDAAERIEAGSILPVVLVWQKDGLVDFNYNIGVALVDENGILRAQHDGAPQGTFGNTAEWENGILYFDAHGLALPDDLSPGQYSLRVAMYDWRDAARLPVWFERNFIEGDYAEIATVEVVSPGQYTPLQTNEITEHLPVQETVYRFGDHIQLTGYLFSDMVETGSGLIVTTTWDIQQTGNHNATLTLYQNNETQTAVNGLAVSLYNEKFHDGVQTYRHEIYVPEDLPPGTYSLIASVTDWAVPALYQVTPQGTGKGYEVLLGTVEVITSP
ncbi:MAG: hypothetical protein F9K27_14915 [Anaerolineae bacterium]|nr:MAG: hypothetical protein F9K27_14915 [Anaerolineae bacterium]